MTNRLKFAAFNANRNETRSNKQSVGRQKPGVSCLQKVIFHFSLLHCCGVSTQSKTACSCQTPFKLDCQSLTVPSPPVDANVMPLMSHSNCHTYQERERDRDRERERERERVKKRGQHMYDHPSEKRANNDNTSMNLASMHHVFGDMSYDGQKLTRSN